MMGRTLGLTFVAATWTLLACGQGGGEGNVATAPSATASGSYTVEGFTVDKQSGHKRKISGTIILAQQQSRYTATFDLDTKVPASDADTQLDADVIGKGEGIIEGNVLKGTAHTQLVIATAEKVDTAFAFVPRVVHARIENASTATLQPDGTIVIEIENKPAPGEKNYRPTKTTLRGKRDPGGGSPGK